jgi:hypothetical protein
MGEEYCRNINVDINSDMANSLKLETSSRQDTVNDMDLRKKADILHKIEPDIETPEFNKNSKLDTNNNYLDNYSEKSIKLCDSSKETTQELIDNIFKVN